jgi:broad specificity phosphatase PhoE
MISQASIKNFDTICLANNNDQLALVASRIAATQQPVALLAAIYEDDGAHVVVPLATMTEAGLVSNEGKLTEGARTKFNALRKKLRSDKQQPWFLDGGDGKVSVAFAKLGKMPPPDSAELTLPWDNPYTLFQDPAMAQ